MKVRPDDSNELRDFKLISFDVYGTLVDWETGTFDQLKPLVAKLPTNHPLQNNFDGTIAAFHQEEEALCRTQPGLNYRALYSGAYTNLAATLSLPKPSEIEIEAFGSQVKNWQAFPDTVEALHRLSKDYKLVVLSNVDNESFKDTLAGALKGVKFDAIYTAENIGSYKPDLNNFHYLFNHAKEDFGVEKEQVLHTGHGLKADHVAAKQLGLTSVWIERSGGPLDEVKDKVAFTWQFKTMGDMADAVADEAAIGDL
ncbi:uncharacterized protein KY384_002454 [Bacidia gigantensis]|uniref:uncharacterized protein n=1 Tax=Bacidia gigantensis TaxID=2732470 RepID=UPI001D04C7FE|nr:uncharacterized protein KY384_002454 [Bacidia gigantensis]KAG8532577.1 hypothetical protein KY384_002454 [Bacidia gigantensis]